MPDLSDSGVAELTSRYTALQTRYHQLHQEALADGRITPDEQSELDAVSEMLEEIARRLASSEGAPVGSASAGGGGSSGGGSARSADGETESGGFLSDALDAVTEAGSDLLESAGDMLGDAASAATSALEGVVQTFTGTAQEIARSAQGAAEQAAGMLESLVGNAAATARQAAEAALREAQQRAEEAAQVAEQATREAQEATGEAAEAAQQRAQEAAQQARAAAQEAATMLQSLVSEAERQVQGVGQQVVEGAESAARQAQRAIETAANEARDAAEEAREQASGIESEVRDLANAAQEAASRASQQLESLLAEARASMEENMAALIEAAEAAAERAEQTVRQITGMGFTEAEEAKLAELEAAGLDQQEREALVDQARGNPAILEQATAALARMDELNVPPGDRGELIRLAQANQAGFDAAMEVIANMEGGGALDVSDTAMADLANQMSETRSSYNEASDRLQGLVDAGAPQAEIDAVEAELTTLRETFQTARDDFNQREEKRDLLDALSYGPLSVDRPEPMDAEDVTALIQAYGRSPEVAGEAIALAGRAEDPGVIAQNVGAVIDLSESGFAPPGGDPIDGADENELQGMAVNMLRNGAAMGQEYFDGAADYYASGAQSAEDPCGGRSGDSVGDINNRRTAMMGRDMLDADGNVDITSDSARGAMDHMLYHPGSLSPDSYSPNVTQQMQGVYELFENPETATDAADVINGVSAPGDETPNAAGARDIVGQTMGVEPGDVTDADTRAAVLSGMLSPFQQGDAGSCFSTGPARRLRIEDPIQTMENMAEIATTGQFVSPSANIAGPIPANQNIPDGENPMMRSYEYTIATGVAMRVNSTQRTEMNDGLWDAGGNGRGLGEIEGFVGADAWNGSGEVDENGDLVDEGMRVRLQRALTQQLRFDYNATEADTSGGGGGDGNSSLGAFEVVYQGNTIESEAAFQDAVEQIAMAAAGNPEGETRDQISELIQSNEFVDAIYGAYGTSRTEAPWNLAGGGFGTETDQVLTGRNTTEYSLDPPNPGANPGVQTRQLLDNLVANIGGAPGLTALATTGDDANHEFTGTPQHPTFQAISGPDSAERIQEILVDPGQEIASSPMPEQQTSRVYEEQIRDMMRWGSVRDDEESLEALREALSNGPTEGLSPPDLQTYIDGQLTDFNTRQRELERQDADQWRAGQTGPVSDADYQAHLDGLQAEAEARLEDALRGNLTPEFELPHVVVADSNWGGPDATYEFVVAPDPLTGDLRMFERNAFSGDMSLLGENWETAEWFSTR